MFFSEIDSLITEDNQTNPAGTQNEDVDPVLLSGSVKLFTMKFHRDAEVSLSHQSPAISHIRPLCNYSPAKLYNDYIDLPPSYLAV